MISSDYTLDYGYKPTRSLAICSIVIFLLLTYHHAKRLLRIRYRFGVGIVMGGLFEIAGLSARVYSIEHRSDKASHIAQTVLILLAPIFFASSIYTFLDGLVYGSGYSNLSLIHFKWQSKVFFTGDVLSFLAQACGMGILFNANTDHLHQIGTYTILTSLGLQILMLAVFLLCATVFNFRVVHRGLLDTVIPELRLVPMITRIYIFSALMLIRNVFRILEFTNEVNGYLLSHEWPVYVFDITFMVIIMAFTFAWYWADLSMEFHHPTLWVMTEDAGMQPWRD